MASDKVHASNDSRVGTGTVITQDLDGVEGGLLGDTVGGGADSSSNVGAVTLAVTITATSKVLEELGTSIKVGMLNINAGVDDVRASTLTSALVVGVSLATGLGAGKTGDTPRSIVLVNSSLDGDDSILLNVLDLGFVSTALNDWDLHD